MRYRIASAVCAAGIGLLLAACSSGASSSAAAPASSATTQASSPAATSPASSLAASSPAASGATVSLATVSGIPDKALVGTDGRTLYLFEADKNGMSTCADACAAAWPPVTVTGMPQAGSGVSQSLLGTIKRADGATQITYNGHPLYYFVADTGAGTAKGQGSKAFGAEWYVVNASGAKIDND